MPESSEVRIITEDLHKLLKNKELSNIIVLGGRYKTHGNPQGMDEFNKTLPTIIESVKCKGKFIYWTFSNKWFMWNTLGMSGGWTLEKEKHANIEFILKDISIYFRDMRNFGTIKFTDDKSLMERKLAELGPDMFESDTTLSVFRKSIKDAKKQGQTIVEYLMNQKNISGVGNYIKSESLYYAKISPHRIISSLTNQEIEDLYHGIKKVIQDSYKDKGVSIRDYADVNNVKGEYHTKLMVYNQKHDPHGNPIKKETTKDKRSTYWSPKIQY